jgi:hypothetical protein
MTMIQRVKRAAESQNRLVRKPRYQDSWFLIQGDSIVGVYADLEPLARDLGCIRAYERLAA